MEKKVATNTYSEKHVTATKSCIGSILDTTWNQPQIKKEEEEEEEEEENVKPWDATIDPYHPMYTIKKKTKRGNERHV